MTEYDAKMLALIDEGEKEAKAALIELKALWRREDDITSANRKAVLVAHENGARDRDEMRKRYAAEEAPTLRPRASSLPASPLAALGQKDET